MVTVLKKIIILMLIFIGGINSIYFADVITNTTQDWVLSITLLVLNLAIFFLTVILLLCGIVIIIKKIKKRDIAKTISIAEKLLYAILMLIGLLASFIIFVTEFLYSIIPFLALYFSLFFRFKNKKISYLIIGIYLYILLMILIFI